MVQSIEKPAKAIVSVDIPLGLMPVVTPEQFATLVAANSEYIENGALFGLLIDLQQKAAEIYRQDREVEVLKGPAKVDFSEIMPGFELDLKGMI